MKRSGLFMTSLLAVMLSLVMSSCGSYPSMGGYDYYDSYYYQGGGIWGNPRPPKPGPGVPPPKPPVHHPAPPRPGNGVNPSNPSGRPPQYSPSKPGNPPKPGQNLTPPPSKPGQDRPGSSPQNSGTRRH